MMTRLEYFEKGHAKTGLDLGLITPTVYEYYSRYQIYLLAKEQGNGHIESIDITAKLTKASRSTVRRAVEFFTKFHICGNKTPLPKSQFANFD